MKICSRPGQFELIRVNFSVRSGDTIGISFDFLVLFIPNSFSHCNVDQKNSVAISQMFNHVQLRVQWMHLLNNRICMYTYSIKYYITVTKTDGQHPILRPWIRSTEV